MPTLPDLLYVALFAVALPAWDGLVFWPAFRRRSQVDPAQARMRLWRLAIASAWLLVAIGVALWMTNDRSWASLGFVLPEGWRWWTALALCLLLTTYYAYAIVALVRSAEARASVRRQFGGLAAMLPHTRTELHWFGGLSLTAGFCEEFLYRGYFVWVFAPWLGWWGAAALSLPFFAVAHAYQGWSGVLRTGCAGALFTLVVAVLGSLWPAIVLHALVDLGSGVIAWLALREASATTEATRGVPDRRSS